MSEWKFFRFKYRRNTIIFLNYFTLVFGEKIIKKNAIICLIKKGREIANGRTVKNITLKTKLKPFENVQKTRCEYVREN